MSFLNVAQKYINHLHTEVELAITSGQTTPELSFRPILDNFFRDIIQILDSSIVQIHEPKNQSRVGHPDWRFHNNETMGVYGYIEHKPLDLQSTIGYQDYQQQIDKYLQLNQKVILTDGLDFILFIPNADSPQTYSLVDKPVINLQNANPNLLTEQCFTRFFEGIGFRECTETQLIEDVARRTRPLSNDVRELVELEVDEGLDEIEQNTIQILHELKIIVEAHHDPTLSNSQVFGDFVAQILAFGLLYAHRVVRDEGDLPADRYQRIQTFWSSSVHNEYAQRLRPFKALIDLLGDELESPLSKLGIWYDNIRRLLAHIQLRDEQISQPDYHVLYEQFLTVFDPQTRFDYGAFYTPPSLSQYIVRLVRAIAYNELEGLSLFQEGNKLIDPCCGTGSFLEHLAIASDGQFNVPTTIGFEILPAPYTLAHYRLAMLNEGNFPINLFLILTNTLSDALEQEVLDNDFPENLIEVEQNQARNLARPPLTLIIGNPPSSDSPLASSTSDTEIIQELLNDFRPPDEIRTSRQNIQKQLQNEFVKFLRWACNKLADSHPSILAFILPASFARNISYKYARKWLVEQFEKLWVLDFDLDGRSGVRASNMFPTQQGRMLLVGLQSGQSQRQQNSQIFFASMTDLSKSQKREEFEKERSIEEYMAMFEEIPLDSVNYSLSREKAYDRELYAQFWQLCPEGNEPGEEERFVFARHCSGVKFAPSSMFVHVDKAILRRRSRDLANTAISINDLQSRWFNGQSRPPRGSKFSDEVRQNIGLAITTDSFLIRYAYRPFTTTYALWHEPTLKELGRKGGGGTRSRPEVASAYRLENTIGIAVAPAPAEIGEQLHRFASFVWYTPDNDLSKRGNAHIFSNMFPEYKGSKRNWDPTPHSNVFPGLTNHIATALELDDSEARNMIVYYVYGVLCSESYLDAFEGVLHSVAGTWPRIPIPVDMDVFQRIAYKGQQLAEIERDEFSLNECEEINGFSNLYTEEFELGSHSIDEENQQLILFDRNSQVKIEIAPIPTEILKFEISGYRVLQQWLKIYSYPYTRTAFRRTHFEELVTLMCRIHTQINLLQEMDSIVTDLVLGNSPLLTPDSL